MLMPHPDLKRTTQEIFLAKFRGQNSQGETMKEAKNDDSWELLSLKCKLLALTHLKYLFGTKMVLEPQE